MMQHIRGRNKLRSLFSVVLVFSLLLSSFQSIAFADDPTSLEIGTVSGNPGDIVDVPVYIYPGDYSIYGYQLNFTYNPNKLEPMPGVATNKWNTATFDKGEIPASTEVYVNSSFGEEHPIKDGKQEVFVLHFRIKENAKEGSAHVIWNSGTFLGANEAIVGIERNTPGSVTINSSQGSGSGGSEPTEAQSPQITEQPLGKEVNLNDSVQLSVDATVSDGGVLSYQWYTLIMTGESPIEGATSSSLNVPTSTVGTTYYLVKVKNTLGASSKIVSSIFAKVTVNPAVVRGGWQDITGSERPVSSPKDIAVDPNGIVYVVGPTEIAKRTLNGDWQDITPTDRGEDQYTGIAAGPDGTIYVTRINNSDIMDYTNGTWGVIDGTGLSTTVDVAVNKYNNHIYVADAGSQTIKERVNGHWESVSQHSVNPVGLALAGYDLYVTVDNEDEAGALRLWGMDWSNITGGETFRSPKGIAADVYGNVFVADSNNQLVKKLSEGVWTAISTTNDFIAPYGVTLDSNGNIYVVDNENGKVKKFVVQAETPVVHSGVTDLTTDQGTDKPKISVQATVSDGGTLSYRWYSNTENSMEGATLIEGATESNYSVPITQTGQLFYFVEVKNTNALAQNAEAWVTSLVAIVTVSSGGNGGGTGGGGTGGDGSGTGPVITEPTKAQSPQITLQPADISVSLNDSSPLLKVVASVNDGGKLSYQWYRNTKKSVESGNIEPIAGATGSSYDAPTSTLGTTYYFVEVTNTLGNSSTTTPSTVAKVIVSKEIWQDITGPEASFIGANGIAVDPNGTVYVSTSTKIMKRVNNEWVDISYVDDQADGDDEPENYYTGLAADSKGAIYVSMYNNSSILKYNGSTWEKISGTGLSNPSHLAIDEQGQLYVVDGGDVIKTLVNGTWKNFGSIDSYIAGLAVAGGKMYVSNGVTVNMFWNGIWKEITPGVQFIMLAGMAADSNGNVYVADSEGVKKLSNGQTTLMSTKADFDIPFGVALDSVGNLYVVDNMLGKAKKLILNAATPVIHTEPVELKVNQGSESPRLNVNATVSDNGTLSYQWYKNAENSVKGATLIEGATGSSYSVPTNQAGKVYYYVKVTNTNNVAAQNQTATVNTLIATVTVNSSAGSGNTGGGTSSGGNNSSSAGATPVVAPATNDAVIVLVNGKEERIGKSAASKEGDRTVTTITVDQKQLDTKLNSEAQGAVVTIPVSADSSIIIGELTGQMIKKMEDKQAILVVKTGNASYSIPAQQLDIDSISKQLGSTGTLEDIKLSLRIASPEAAMMKVAEDAAKQNALTLVAPSFDFTVKAEYAGKSVAINKFNVYVERSIALPEGIDPSKITTGIVTDPDGSVRHVPTKVTVENGKYFAHINSLTNSLYSVVWHPLTFKDVENHWAKDAVNDMGSRLIVNGRGNDLYNPNADMTRAEFAAIMMRGLGLKPVDGHSPFADVKASDWYHSAVLTAYDYKLIDGFEDGTFRPQEKITREQAMVILSKAMAITGLTDKLTGKGSDELLKPYTDVSLVAEWAKAGAATSLEAGVVSGRGAEQLAPKANITRAEVATIVQRLLKVSGLI
ncbi:S-layer homology domain-containing protein [Paenibacillus silvae]|uniref:S-layer homology domain-containing protein n=1 Tax=Paenibacillus silvae TaxID=1325358 RepID=UPI0025A0BF45|nr:S-layer homology domain-containing protein [Paenibacillus silvae]MDM5279854.1 S-layer homology domain-containing protein [Paenibacillus silvae]